MRNCFKLFLLILFLNSCIGVSYFHLSAKKVEKEYDAKKYMPRPGKDVVSIAPRTIKKVYYKNDVLEMWGKPKKIIPLENDQEEWLYKRGLNWAGGGIMFWVVIPIPLPLVIPVGRYDIRLIFDKNDKLEKIFYEEDWGWGFLYSAHCHPYFHKDGYTCFVGKQK